MTASEKAPVLSVSTPSGKTRILFKRAERNACSPISFNALFSANDTVQVQPEKQFSPISFTLAGMTISSSTCKDPKTFSPSLSTVSGMVIL